MAAGILFFNSVYLRTISWHNRPANLDQQVLRGPGPVPVEDLLYRWVEEGRQQPPPASIPSAAAWRAEKIFHRCFGAAGSIGCIAYLLVMRFLTKDPDPDLMDPLKLAVLLTVSLGPLGWGFMVSQGDYSDGDDDDGAGAGPTPA